MRLSELIIKNIAQKVMAHLVLDIDLMTLNISKLDYFHILKFIVGFMVPLNFFVENINVM